MSEIVRILDTLPVGELMERSDAASEEDVRASLARETRDLRDLAVLLSPAADKMIEEIARAASELTAQRFGRTILLYAPLYLSNECVNVCTYCGFRRDIDVARATLTADEIESETKFLTGLGFRHLLIVSGEHPKWVNMGYLTDAIRDVRRVVPSVSIEVQPLTHGEYVQVVEAGADGVTLYQECYDRDLYAQFHTHGPKKNYDDRLDGPARAAHAGIRRLGIGTLLGLAPWRAEVFRLAAHARHLMKHHWRTHLSISFPRIRHAASEFAPPHPVDDRTLVQMVCALRLLLPDVGLILSTREAPGLRDGLARIGITQMSAGSRTEPGGYLEPNEAEGQFDVDDSRSPSEVAARLGELGLEAVWKDWEVALHG